jgi:hypothetical protein
MIGTQKKTKEKKKRKRKSWGGGGPHLMLLVAFQYQFCHMILEELFIIKEIIETSEVSRVCSVWHMARGVWVECSMRLYCGHLRYQGEGSQ